MAIPKLTVASRAAAVHVAAAHDFNNELTIILSAAAEAMLSTESGHPARPLLLDLQMAAQRCAWKASSLLNFGARHGALPVAIRLEELLDSE